LLGLNVPPPLPRYFDRLIEGFWAGAAGRDVHLGYWDNPPPLSAPCSAEEFKAAQGRLTDIVVALAGPQAGRTVLDVGCGFGGTLAALAKWPGARLVGVNHDERQLAICRSLAAGVASLSLIAADACALPFGAASFDCLFCVEAMFHFRSRPEFLREAARVLRPGERATVTDIWLRPPGPDAPWPLETIEATLRSEYGPWPQLWLTMDDVVGAAAAAGLQVERLIDATRQTLPSYRVTAPGEPSSSRPSAGTVMRWLHQAGYLTYACISFVKN
jgi:SAM-dependent methyltransferase